MIRLPEIVVAVDRLVKSFPGVGAGRRRGETKAVKEASFSLERGGALAIVGESGSGKTTVARCLAGLETPTSGSIEVCGEAWTGSHGGLKARRKRARSIQLVFQDPYQSLDPRQKVGAALEEALSIHGKPGRSDGQDEVGGLLERVGLSGDVRDCYPRVLSGGQRQRVAIARALAAEPEVMIFDESVAALDVSIQAQVLNLISDLRESAGLTTIFISHDLAVVRQVSETMIVMCRGEIVERGATDAVLSSPQDPYTKKLIASVPRVGWDPREAVLSDGAEGEEPPGRERL